MSDISLEPPRWRSNASGPQWTTVGGCRVRIDVASAFRGSEHCGFQTARFIVLGDPPGVGSHRRPGSARYYVRDPRNVLRDPATSVALEADTVTPADAVDTGLRRGAAELWAVPEDTSHIYLRLPARTERWPRDRDPTLCM